MNTTVETESRSTEADSQAIFSIDKNVFYNLANNCTEEGRQTLKRLYEELLSRWSERVKSKKYAKSFIWLAIKLFCLHGVPFECRWEIFNRGDKLAEMHSFFKLTPAQNIGLFFKDVSQFENALRWINWINHQTAAAREKHDMRLGYHFERTQFIHMIQNQNYRGMANILSYTHFIRKRIPDIAEKIANVSSGFQFAVQILLASDRGKSIDLNEKIHQLAENCITNLSTSIYSPLLAHLCELLIVCIIYNQLDTAAVIIAMEAAIAYKRARYYKHVKTWNAYRRLAEFIMYTEDRRNLLLDPIMTAEDLFEQMRVFNGEAGSVFCEAAIRIFIATENYDRLYPCVQTFARTVPRRAKLVADLMDRSNLPDERDAAIQSACQQIENKPHSSEIIWIDWCEMVLDNPRRYGPIEEVNNSCVRILFEFLDFGGNRNCERAWKALHFILPNVDREVVKPLWLDRSSWWTKFHSRCVDLSEEAQHWRDKILRALQTELTA